VVPAECRSACGPGAGDGAGRFRTA